MTKESSGPVIPGISDADELGNGGRHKASSSYNSDDISPKTSPKTDSNDAPSVDKEAAYKNLTFQGVPNSALNESDHDHETTTKPKLENNKDSVNGTAPNSKRRSFILQDQQFDIWRKEFKQAFRKVSVLSKFKSMRNGRQPSSQQQVQVSDQVDEKDIYTQHLASDLIDSLLAGCPAALFASTQFLRDEHGQRRAPLLLAMLGVKVEPLKSNTVCAAGNVHNDATPNNQRRRASAGANSGTNSESSSIFSEMFDMRNDDGNRKLYELNLEYGVGENRLKWSVVKSYRELNNLHSRLKLVSFQQNTLNKLYIDHNRYHKMHLPHFPHVDDYEKKYLNSHKDKRPSRPNGSANLQYISSQGSSHLLSDDNNSSVSSLRSSLNFALDKIKVKHLQDLIEEQEDLTQPMHLRLERYLRLLNIALCLRPQANRLFQFYELSPIGNLLSYEEGRQSKEGYLIIRSTAKAQGWRVSHFKFNDFKEMIERHTTKWFLVRQSYIIYVSDLYSTTPLDVFLIDPKFKIRCSGHKNIALDDKNNNKTDIDWNPENSRKISTKLLITLENGERKLQMICKSESSLKQWTSSISHMAKASIWSQRHRFDSFAPIRKGAFCKFLVDGRDYFWALSEALMMAEDVIYIHDWWLSPELYMRRPVNGNQQFRIDRILKERAENGVKIFIVVYRNVANTVGTDSLWTKHSMLSLHPNIHLIRSPNQWLQNTYFWAHHEKMTVIDNTIAFMGGIDLCYGRYDTPEHVLRDDHEHLKDQIFPGKDYSNARVCDFYDLDKPFESMYDRKAVPRMPWHDVHMMTIGEAARDMARHFVQRWNYLLRQKRPSRPTPLLTPPIDFTEEQLKNSPFFQMLKPRSTCEVQVLRSAGNWSLGLKETEKSIQNAYLKLIETSEHYIYIENQFFITTSHWDGVVIENKIGDAIVDRIIRANSEGKTWKAFILIPLMPGFDSPIDQPEASSVRVIMQCQYQSISRGETSIFSRLKKVNVDPLQYIQFYSLRKWSTIGPHEKLVTEQLYVHAKVLIVDDRSCIIGSANINERSQLGSRDSEVAIIIRDTDLVKSKMQDKDYYAGRFAFELRKRLMREHMGCDVDLVEIVERKFGLLEKLAKENCGTLHLLDKKATESDKFNSAMIELAYREVFDVKHSATWEKKYSDYAGISNDGICDPVKQSSNERNSSTFTDQLDPVDEDAKKSKLPSRIITSHEDYMKETVTNYHSFNYRAGEENIGIRDNKPMSTDPRLTNNEKHKEDVEGLGPDGWKKVTNKFKETVTEQLRSWAMSELSSSSSDGKKKSRSDFLPDKDVIEQYLQEGGISSEQKWDMLKRICYLQHLSYKNKKTTDKKMLKAHKNADKQFGGETEESHREHMNILEEQELDDSYIDELLAQMAPSFEMRGNSNKRLLNMKFIDPYLFDDPLSESFYEDLWFSISLRNTLLFRLVFHCQPDNAVQSWRDYKEYNRMIQEFSENQDQLIDLEIAADSEGTRNSSSTSAENLNKGDLPLKKDAKGYVEKGDTIGEVPQDDIHHNLDNQEAPRRKERSSKAAALKMRLSGSLLYGFNQRIFDKHTAKRILQRVHGHLVVFPTEWLAREVESKNWFYNVDRLPPIDIYD